MGRKLIKSKSDKVRHDHIYNLVEGDVENFIKDCLSLPHTVSVESLKPDHSFFRIKRDDISIEEAMEFIFASKVKFFSFILRSGFGSELNLNKKYWEFGASGLIGGCEYFVWIEIDEESGFKLVEKYNIIKNSEL